MANMVNKAIRSSMHVPMAINGMHCTVNFWSAEEAAFPPEAVRLLVPLARLMADGSAAVARSAW